MPFQIFYLIITTFVQRFEGTKEKENKQKQRIKSLKSALPNFLNRCLTMWLKYEIWLNDNFPYEFFFSEKQRSTSRIEFDIFPDSLDNPVGP